jgi:hypothetical protein
MIDKKTWDEFRDTGLLLYINQILHAFGYAICCDVKDDIVSKAYPARVKYRGFTEASIDEAYKKIALYNYENAKDLLNDLNSEEIEQHKE